VNQQQAIICDGQPRVLHHQGQHSIPHIRSVAIATLLQLLAFAVRTNNGKEVCVAILLYASRDTLSCFQGLRSTSRAILKQRCKRLLVPAQTPSPQLGCQRLLSADTLQDPATASPLPNPPQER